MDCIQGFSSATFFDVSRATFVCSGSDSSKKFSTSAVAPMQIARSVRNWSPPILRVFSLPRRSKSTRKIDDEIVFSNDSVAISCLRQTGTGRISMLLVLQFYSAWRRLSRGLQPALMRAITICQVGEVAAQHTSQSKRSKPSPLRITTTFNIPRASHRCGSHTGMGQTRLRNIDSAYLRRSGILTQETG